MVQIIVPTQVYTNTRLSRGNPSNPCTDHHSLLSITYTLRAWVNTKGLSASLCTWHCLDDVHVVMKVQAGSPQPRSYAQAARLTGRQRRSRVLCACLHSALSASAGSSASLRGIPSEVSPSAILVSGEKGLLSHARGPRGMGAKTNEFFMMPPAELRTALRLTTGRHSPQRDVA